VFRAANARTPVRIRRGKLQTLELYLRDGEGKAATVTTASTLTVYDPDGVAVVPAGTPIDSVGSEGQAQYNLAAVPVTTPYSMDWSIDWELVDTLGFKVPILQSAHLVKKATHPVIDGSTLLKRHRRLVANKHYTISELQDFVDEAWILIDSWLRRSDRYLEEWLEASALGPAHLDLSLHLMFADMAKDIGGHWAAERDRYMESALVAFNGADGKGDSNQDGVVDGRQQVSTLWGSPFSGVAGVSTR
jgi:hypothetical protein